MTHRKRYATAASALVALLGVWGLTAMHSGASTGVRATTTRPNIVFILTDDLSWNLINRRFAPHVMALEKRGVTFNHYFVADSLCCPSRATIFTGLYPHDTHVVTNLPPDGGFQKFQAERLAGRTWAVALHRRGYATSMAGKYLNGYGDPQMTQATAPVPPGWSDWHVSNSTGYAEFNYLLNNNGHVDSYGGPAGGCGSTAPDDYGVDELSRIEQGFIHAKRHAPFALEIATFAPHKPYVPAPRNACDFPGLTEPRDPSFDANNRNPPAWLGSRPPLGERQLAKVDASFRKRAQDVEAIDRLVADVEARLRADGLLDRTYIVFSSDNGYHLGQHRLTQGKQTAFDTDIRVPLIVAGPGVPRGKVVTRVAQNVDLAPTFVQLAGGRRSSSVEGHSLVPLLHPSHGHSAWRTVALVEHHRLQETPADPDFEGKGTGDPTTYQAIRISADHLPHFHGHVEAVYVEYQDAAHEREYYDIRRDPYERDNIAGRLTAAQRAELHSVLGRLVRCHSASACWRAGLPR